MYGGTEKSSLADYLVVDTPGYKYVNSVPEPGSIQRTHLQTRRVAYERSGQARGASGVLVS